MRNPKYKIYPIAVFLCIALMVFLAGCGKWVNRNPDQRDLNQTSPPAVSEEVKETVNLYFSDDQAQYLMPEKREVTVRKGSSIEEAVIKELINGPADPALMRTIPKEAKLLSVSVSGGVANVNFSREFKTKHWGGSSGETLTLYSVVNTLAELPGITSVQFLLEGEKMDTLAGHLGTEDPIKPDWDLVRTKQ